MKLDVFETYLHGKFLCLLWFSRLKIRRTLHDLILELVHHVQTDYKLQNRTQISQEHAIRHAAFNSKEVKLDVQYHTKTKCTKTCASNPCCLIQETSTWHAFKVQQSACQSNNVTILGFSSVHKF